MKQSSQTIIKQKILDASGTGLKLEQENTVFKLYPSMTKEGYTLMLEEDGGCDSLSSLQKGTEQLIATGALIITSFGILEYC